MNQTPVESNLTKVHAFQIKRVSTTDWMYSDTPSYAAHGTNGEYQQIDDDMYHLFKPEEGHWLIVWPHGLVTFRDDVSFKEDFTYRSGTVFETPLKALFQEGMTTREYLDNRALERKRRMEEISQRLADYVPPVAPAAVVIACGVVKRTVVPGLLQIPSGMTLPLMKHIPILPLLSKIKLPKLE